MDELHGYVELGKFKDGTGFFELISLWLSLLFLSGRSVKASFLTASLIGMTQFP